MGHEPGYAAFHQTRRLGLLIEEKLWPEVEVLHQGEQMSGREDRVALAQCADDHCLRDRLSCGVIMCRGLREKPA